MPKLTIDNRPIEVPPGTTLLAAAEQLGIHIPTLCHYEGIEAQTSCLVCLVKVNKASRLVPSCATIAQEGMEVESEAAEVRSFRKAALELLLGEHAGDCYAPCENVCPAHMDIPTMMRNIESGDLQTAVITVKKAIPLPATLGRICPELCEKGCRRAGKDESVSICSLKRYVGDKDLESETPYVPECRPATGRRVAIIGSGPAGLTAAWFLRQSGHAVTIFDANPFPGGALRYSIDEANLPRATLNSEIELVRKLGAEFRMNTRIVATLSSTDEIAFAQLQHDFDAILLALGPIDKDKAAAMGLNYLGKGLKVDRETLATNLPKVFAAGSAIVPAHYAIRAVADGQHAARSINDFLGGPVVSEPPSRFSSRLGHLTPGETTDFFSATPQTHRTAPHHDGADWSMGLADQQASAEASRCAHCDCSKLDTCRLHKVAASYNAHPAHYRGARREFHRQSSHPLVIYESGKCILCGLCVAIAAKAAEPLGLTFIGRGFNVEVGVPLSGKLSAGLERVARQCADACPSGALAMRFDAPERREDALPVRLSLPQVRG